MVKLALILSLIASLATVSAANFWPVIKQIVATATHSGGGGSGGQCS
jgi:hypothetical protein